MQQPNEPSVAHDPDYRLLNAAAMLALFCVGMYAASFGPALPFLADELGVSLDTAGLLFTALFGGSIVASAAIALALLGRNTRLMTLAGLLIAATGVLLLGFAPAWPLALAGAAVLGIGDGLIIAASHILVANISRNVAGGLNRLNLVFAVGAIAGPIWAGALLATTGEPAYVYGGIAVLLAVSAVVLLAAATPDRVEFAAPAEVFRLPRDATTWMMGCILLLYVGAEFGLGSWVATYARESADAGVMAGALITSGYWGALGAGRLASTFYFSRQREPTLLLLLSFAGAGMSALLLVAFAGTLAVGAIGAFGAGICLGPVWGTTIAMASGPGRSSATATTVTMGNIGGLALPWMQGKVLVGAGPEQGVAVTVVLCAAMFVLVVLYRLRVAT
jgi:fucose permease